MSVSKRTIVHARRELGDTIAGEIRFLEQSMQDAVIWASRCSTVLLEGHRNAALPGTVGMDVIQLIGEVHAAASANCERIAQAHARLRQIADQHNIPFAGRPDCPPNEMPGADIFRMP